jgi:hypothetical protein
MSLDPGDVLLSDLKELAAWYMWPAVSFFEKKAGPGTMGVFGLPEPTRKGV